MAGQYKDLALDWESCNTIRNRFRRDLTWIQWPTTDLEANENPEHGDGPNDDDLAKRPVCTRALELNADALLMMLYHYQGNFIDIGKLQLEVR